MIPGQEILRCEPFAYVVNQSLHRSMCDFCLRDTGLNNSNGIIDSGKTVRALKKCTSCKYVYYCDRECQRGAWKMHRDECKYLTAVHPKVPTDTVRLIARIILKLRMGGNVEIAKLPDGSCRRFDDLESHSKDIVKDPCRIKAFICFFGVLQELFRDNIPPKSEVLDIYGRVIINSFNVMNAEYQAVGVGLYLPASALDHSCEPNAAIAFDGRFLMVRSITDAPKLTFPDVRISYVNTMMDTQLRKKDLREQYYFDCDCAACAEVTERERQKRACMRCPACSAPIVMEDKDSKSKGLVNGAAAAATKEEEEEGVDPIHCPHCKLEVPAEHVKKYWQLRERVTSFVLRNVGKHPEPMEQCLEYVDDMREVFHPFEKTYWTVLEACYERQVAAEDWPAAADTARELCVAYKRMYPRFDVNTALLLMKMAKIASLLGRTAEAGELAAEAGVVLRVTHGEAHELYRGVLLPLVNRIRLELAEKRLEGEEQAFSAAANHSG